MSAMTNGRPDPDELLRHVQEAERRAKRGKLVLFFGAAAGVGKTYAMLEAARGELDLSRDVVVGFVETHGRYDTQALVLGFELLPRRKVDYRGVVVEEFDLDAALARKPGLVLVDELAHTNADGSRHQKRWQDVEELLDAGIDVYSTMNVQHIESLNDVIAQITGIIVRETVPDRVFDEATEIRLIDLPPTELLERLGQGKVYVPHQAERAIQSFFREGNLIALRELALRRTADRVEAQMHDYKTEHGIQRVWPAGERVLVAVSPSPASARLVRAARRMAGSLHAKWVAVYVQTPASLRMPDRDRQRVAENLRLAEQLGAETVTLSGQSAAQETLAYARTHNVTKIVVGKPTHPRWRDVLGAPFLDEIVRSSGGIDVYVISGDESDVQRAAPEPRPAVGRDVPVTTYATSALVSALTTVVAMVIFGRQQLADVVMVYLLGIIVVAMRYGYGPSLLAAVLGVLQVDFFFVPPYYSLAVSDFRHVETFAVMLVVAVVISSLTQRIRDRAAAARQRERRTASLYALSRDLAGTRAVASLSRVAAQHLHDLFEVRVAILLPDADGRLSTSASGATGFEPDEKERGVVDWVWEHDRPAGLGTDTLPSASALYAPLHETRGCLGVLGLRPENPERFADPEQRALIQVFATQIASALERAHLTEEAQHVHVQMESERLRSSLLSSVSHDLRTPLAVITGAASVLMQPDVSVTPETRIDLSATIHEEAERLNRLVRNLLDMTRLTAGGVTVAKTWQPLVEVVGAVLERLEVQLAKRPVDAWFPTDLPPVPIDAVLIEQVFINLLENALKYTPSGSPIELSAERAGSMVIVSVADRGPGIPADQIDQVFEKFYRLPREREGGGAGLGLAICRGIVEAHGGRIWAENRDGGGAVFRFILPLDGVPPIVETERSP